MYWHLKQIDQTLHLSRQAHLVRLGPIAELGYPPPRWRPLRTVRWLTAVTSKPTNSSSDCHARCRPVSISLAWRDGPKSACVDPPSDLLPVAFPGTLSSAA